LTIVRLAPARCHHTKPLKSAQFLVDFDLKLRLSSFGRGASFMRIFSILVLAASLAGCMETTNQSFNGPSGTAVETAKCNQSSTSCLQKAAQTCGGPYLVLDSESHAGGLLADVIAGPVTWYSMTYQCGRSDGKMPTFAFRGPQYVEPAQTNVNVQVQR
jgi:hypothetical protein